MAHNLRVPALLWKTVSGNVTLSLVDCPVAKTLVASSKEEALREMAAYLEAFAQENGVEAVEPELEEVQLRHYNVSSPSRYHAGLRIYNTGFEVRVRIPAAVGTQSSGGFLCVIPTLNLSFDYHSETEERTLAQYFIKTALQSLPPRTLSTMYADTDAELVDVTVRIKEQTRGLAQNDLQTYGVLASVAEPVIRGRGLRAKYPAAWGAGVVCFGYLRQSGGVLAEPVARGRTWLWQNYRDRRCGAATRRAPGGAGQADLLAHERASFDCGNALSGAMGTAV